MSRALDVSGFVHDAIIPDESHDMDRVEDKEIMEIAGRIGNEWMEVGIYLGYEKSTLCHLEQVYPKSPKFRNFMMIAEWCDVVFLLRLNVRKSLAKILLETGLKHLSDQLSQDVGELLPLPEEVVQHVRKINFDHPVPNVIGYFDMQEIIQGLGNPGQVAFPIDAYLQSTSKSPDLSDQGNVYCEALPAPDETTIDDAHVWAFEQLKAILPVRSKPTNGDLLKLLDDLSLVEFYPGKIKITDIREIQPPILNLNEKHLPWLLLTKIIALNYNAREEDLNILFEKNDNISEESEPYSDDHMFEDNTVNSINPLDLFYVTFLCCDQMLKQEVILKLFTSRLAVPFIYRDFNQQLVLSQFALRTILIDRRVGEKYIQVDALNYEMKTVAFLRFGTVTLSKSEIMNKILSDQYHNTFFNRDCPLGTSQRKVANGLVEASWFIPSGREDDTFKEVILFFNLRGDCKEHQEEFKTLCKLSTTLVVHADIKQLTSDPTKEMLNVIHECKVSVIYALESNDFNINPTQIWKEYKQSMHYFKDEMRLLNLKTATQTKSSSYITKNMRKLLCETLCGKKPIKLCYNTDQLEISDERKSHVCSSTKQMAKHVMHSIVEMDSTQKECILPLQGKVWSDWCSYLKKLYKSKDPDEKHFLESRMHLLRKEQVHKIKNELHSFTKLFLQYLESEFKRDIDNSLFFLTWMKLYLDIKSRRVVPDLIMIYNDSCFKLRSATENNMFDRIGQLKEEAEKAEENLVAASFGLEHLIRELSQVYEAAKACQTHISSVVLDLPVIMSKLIQHGYPLEIMDGDTATVPFIWIQAVLQQLKRDIGDRKLLTISVLGIQSSGKSTLLNAMFGLQFAVSAGRCTRGVFAQLVKVTEGVLPYEYVLVIDTEGLRAPELADKNFTHDNELATFVLGLGNITIINIKGENTKEMEDVLQIAVHAFLRLKMANGNLQLNQTCIFVHQNVPALDAPTKMLHSRQKMMEKLDKLTLEAAKQEGLADINSFSQVIEVNPEAHMWYFSDLWYGDPPMAPINVGYSRNVQGVKKHILFDFAKQRKTFLTISETIEQMNDLRIGILSDNFVFSFRNSLEVKAYHTMDVKFHKLVWAIEWMLQLFIQKNVYVKILGCANEDQIEETTENCLKTLREVLQWELAEKTDEWNNFIDNCPLREITEQWRQNRIFHLTEHVTNLLANGEKHIKVAKTQQIANLVSTKKRGIHESELRRKAKDLANQYKGKSLSETELEKIFNATWTNWVPGIEHEIVPVVGSVQDEVEKILFQLFQADGPLISKELERTNNLSYAEMRRLENSIAYKELEEHHISISQKWYQKLIGFVKEKSLKKEQCKKQAIHIINRTFNKIDTTLSAITCVDNPFENTNVKRVFMILFESINSYNSGIDDTTIFTITAALRIKLAVHVARYITIVFAKMEERYFINHNIPAQMQKYKNTVWQYFRDVYENKNDEVKVANIIIHFLKRIVKQEIQRVLPHHVVHAIIYGHFPTKNSLMLAIMADLAEKENFEKYSWYINDPENFTLHWITNYTHNHMFGSTENTGNNYMNMVRIFLNDYTRIITECAQTATLHIPTSSDGIGKWMHIFENSIREHLPIPPHSFSIPSNQQLIDFRDLCTYLLEQLQEMGNLLEQELDNESKHSVKWHNINPCHRILKVVWGCNEKCPFCKETCMKTLKSHYGEKHACIQHRSPGVVGRRIEKTNVISWESCNYHVYSDRRFYCGAADMKCRKSGICKAVGSKDTHHPFRSYSVYIPDWKIKPSPLMDSSNYWMWFVYRFRKELVETYGYVIPTSISKWGSITKIDAIRSLCYKRTIIL